MEMFELINKWNRDDGSKRFITVRKIKGSPCFAVQECYQTEDSPTGYYNIGEIRYIKGPQIRTFSDAASEVLRLCAHRYEAARDLTDAIPA